MGESPYRPRRLVVVSPHLDDAVLSVWTALRGHGDATVLTCFAGEPPVGAAVSAWDRQGGAPAPENGCGCAAPRTAPCCARWASRRCTWTTSTLPTATRTTAWCWNA